MESPPIVKMAEIYINAYFPIITILKIFKAFSRQKIVDIGP